MDFLEFLTNRVNWSFEYHVVQCVLLVCSIVLLLRSRKAPRAYRLGAFGFLEIIFGNYASTVLLLWILYAQAWNWMPEPIFTNWYPIVEYLSSLAIVPGVFMIVAAVASNRMPAESVEVIPSVPTRATDPSGH